MNINEFFSIFRKIEAWIISLLIVGFLLILLAMLGKVEFLSIELDSNKQTLFYFAGWFCILAALIIILSGESLNNRVRKLTFIGVLIASMFLAINGTKLLSHNKNTTSTNLSVSQSTEGIDPQIYEKTVENQRNGIESKGNLSATPSLTTEVSVNLEPEKSEEEKRAQELKDKARDILLNKERHGIEEARTKFKEAKALTPEDPQIAYYLAWLDDLDYSLSLENNNNDKSYTKVACENPSKRYEEAMKLFSEYPPEDNISRQMVIEIGHYLSNKEPRKGGHDKAIDLYDKYILEISDDISVPVTHMALVSRGMAYFWKGSPEDLLESYDDFRKAILNTPYNQDKPSNQIAYNIGSVFAMMSTGKYDYQKSIEWYRLAIEGGTVSIKDPQKDSNVQIVIDGDPKLDKAYRDLGFALLLNEKDKNDRKERYENALEKFENAIQIVEEKNESPNYLAYIGKGIAQYFTEDSKKALETLKFIEEGKPYYEYADFYIKKIEKCESSTKKCLNSQSEITHLQKLNSISILTDQGIARLFGNVTIHENVLDNVLEIEHDVLYKGPCKTS
ncbi:MAG: hypothetical protein AAGA80_04680 [Cyanobacteria bacterium P01_F01_bin.143]